MHPYLRAKHENTPCVHAFASIFIANNLRGLEPQLIKLEFIIYLPKLKVHL